MLHNRNKYDGISECGKVNGGVVNRGIVVVRYEVELKYAWVVVLGWLKQNWKDQKSDSGVLTTETKKDYYWYPWMRRRDWWLQTGDWAGNEKS